MDWTDIGVQVLSGVAGIALGLAVFKGCFYGSGPSIKDRMKAEHQASRPSKPAWVHGPNVNPAPDTPRPINRDAHVDLMQREDDGSLRRVERVQIHKHRCHFKFRQRAGWPDSLTYVCKCGMLYTNKGRLGWHRVDARPVPPPPPPPTRYVKDCP